MYLSIIIIAIILIFSFYKNQNDLHMFQLKEYKISHYKKWLQNKTTSYPYETAIHYAFIIYFLTAILIFSLSLMPFIKDSSFMSMLKVIIPIMLFLFMFFILTYMLGYYLKTTSFTTKKKLVYTPRAKRLNIAMFIIYLIIFLCFIILPIDLSIVLSIAILYYSKYILFLANTINKPIEKFINSTYTSEAKRLLNQNPNLIVIGITGSYGKTSTKNILYKLLSTKYNTLMTPHSYNTLMGVTRAIRENLKPTHQIFIVEMGANERGEIKEICNLVEPSIGIITSIGPQHLETFGSIENIQLTKRELFDGVSKYGQIYINHNDKLSMELDIREDLTKTYFGVENNEPKQNKYYFAKDIVIDNKGTHFTCSTNEGDINGQLKFRTQLLGEHNITNIIGSIAIAHDLGIDLKHLSHVLYDIEPINHRLSYKINAQGYTVLDDSFNSNPVGSKNALKVLKSMQGNKKIIITPGMIELGEKQYELNKEFGIAIAHSCDYVILVGKTQTKPIQDGLKQAEYNSQKIIIADDILSAFNHLNQIVEQGDVVLIENDLPDTFNE